MAYMGGGGVRDDICFFKMSFTMHCDSDMVPLKINLYKVIFWKGGGHKNVLCVYLYINLRRSRDCHACPSRPAGVILSCVCLCHRAASFTYFGEVLCCPHKRIVTITKVYIARNTIQVEIIRFHKN